MWDLLIAAIAKGDVAIAIKLINLMSSTDFNKDYSNLSYNQIPLHYAAHLKRVAIVEKLLTARPELVKIVDKNGNTALHVAVNIANNEIIVDKILTVINKVLTNNTEVDSVDEYDQTTLNQVKVPNIEETMISRLIAVEIILDTIATKYEIEKIYTRDNHARKLSVQKKTITEQVNQEITRTKNLLENNLATLVSSDEIKNHALRKLLTEENQTNNSRLNHHLIEKDNNPKYGYYEFNQLLYLKLNNKDQFSITPVIAFENKNSLIANITAATKEVMNKSKIAVMPIYSIDNNWTGLVIKKQADSSLQVLYSDPKGEPLMYRKNSSTIIKCISKVNSEMIIIDICLKQQNNDCYNGSFAINNLVMLATSDTSNLNKVQLQKLLQIDNYEVEAICNQHSVELSKVVRSNYSSSQKLTNNEVDELCIAFDITNLDLSKEIKVCSADNYESQTIGDSS